MKVQLLLGLIPFFTILSQGGCSDQHKRQQSTADVVHNRSSADNTGFGLIFGSDDRQELTHELYKATVGIIETKGPSDSSYVRVCTAFASGIDEITTARHCLPEEMVDEFGRSYRVAFGDGPVFDLVKGNIREFTTTDVLQMTVPGITQYLSPGEMNDELTAVLVAFDKDRDGLFIAESGEVGFLDNFITHTLDTLPSASGGPIISGGAVVGIHLGSLKTLVELEGEVLTLERNIAVKVDKLSVASLGDLNGEYTPECSVLCKVSNSVKQVLKPVAEVKWGSMSVCGRSKSITVGLVANCVGSWTFSYLTGMAINANIDNLPISLQDILRNPYVKAGSAAYGAVSNMAKCGFCDDDVMSWCNYRDNFRKACRLVR